MQRAGRFARAAYMHVAWNRVHGPWSMRCEPKQVRGGPFHALMMRTFERVALRRRGLEVLCLKLADLGSDSWAQRKRWRPRWGIKTHARTDARMHACRSSGGRLAAIAAQLTQGAVGADDAAPRMCVHDRRTCPVTAHARACMVGGCPSPPMQHTPAAHSPSGSH